VSNSEIRLNFNYREHFQVFIEFTKSFANVSKVRTDKSVTLLRAK
jgi:hypothetical protein